jgi:sugar phosphate isomerase/epimerase
MAPDTTGASAGLTTQPERKARVEIGISSWTLPWSIGLDGYPEPPAPVGPIDLLDCAVDCGVKVVQFADNLPLVDLPDDALDEVAAYARDRGLAIELGTRSLDLDHLRRYLEVATRVQAPILRTVLSGSMLERDELMRAGHALRDLVPDLERHDVVLALENNESFAAAEFAEIVAAADSPLVGICLDTANSLGRPETFWTVTEELAEQTVMFHAKDYEIHRIDTRMGFTIEGRPLGDGRVDFAAVLERLTASAPGDFNVIIEHWPPFKGDIESTIESERRCLDRSLAFLRSLVDSHGTGDATRT